MQVRKELDATLRSALGDQEYERLVAGAWFYDCDGPMYHGTMTKVLTPIAMKRLGMAVGTGADAWAAIEDCTAGDAEAPLKIPAKLADAWDCAKRSREYLNAKDADLDARCFAHAAREKTSKQ